MGSSTAPADKAKDDPTVVLSAEEVHRKEMEMTTALAAVDDLNALREEASRDSDFPWRVLY